MKKFLLLQVFLFCLIIQISLYGQINQEWKWVHPSPQGNSLTYIKAFSASDWVAVGNLGTFLSTTNAGTDWKIYTNAGGINSVLLNRNLLSAWFFDISAGIVCGTEGYIAKTSDGGLNWDSIYSGVTGSLTGMHFINSTTGFISCAVNILKTTDAGSSWTLIPFDSSAIANNIFALDEDHIYVASGGGVVFATDNGGLNWNKYSTGVGIFNDVNFINANTGFVCGTNGIVKVTTNGGVNWNNIPIGVSMNLFQLYVRSLNFRSSFTEKFNGSVFPPAGWKIVNVLGDSSFWIRSVSQSYSSPASAFINNECDSAFGGLDWLITPQISVNPGDSLIFWLRLSNIGLSPDSLCIRVSTTDTLLSSFTERILYLAEGINYPDSLIWNRYSVSLDSFAGQNIYIGFKHQNFCGNGLFLDDIQVGFDSLSAEVFVVGDTTRLFKTDNFGVNWSQISLLDPVHKWINTWNTMDINDSLMIVAGTGGAINVSLNSGINWSEVNKKISGGTMQDLWCDYGTGNVWVVGSQGKLNVFDQVLYSSNGGITFTNQHAGNNPSIYRSIDMVNSNTGFICGNLSNIRKTTNGGLNWDSLVTPIPNGNILVKIDFVNENTGWVFSNTSSSAGTIWRTTDGGLNWVRQNLIDSVINGYKVNTAFMVNENIGFCANGLSAIHMTTTGGESWFLRTPSVFSSYAINEIYMMDENKGYFCGNTQLFKTFDQFNTYDSVPHPLRGTIVSTKWIDINNGFIVSSNGLTAKTTNSGEDWEIMPTSASLLTKIFIRSVDTAYVVGSNGSVLKLQKGLVGISWKNVIPAEYFLGQNYPNPFNPVTEFKFGLGSIGKVSLKIYDITGRIVHTFFDNTQLNPGTITVKYDGSDLSSGVYFYTLIIDGSRIETRKMVLIK